jgi:hypothetical protein
MTATVDTAVSFIFLCVQVKQSWKGDGNPKNENGQIISLEKVVTNRSEFGQNFSQNVL